MGLCLFYKGCKTTISVHGKLSSSYSVKVGVHQGSALSRLLLIIVVDVLTEDVRDGWLMKLWYADGLVLCGESLNEVINKYGRWKNAVEGKGWRWMLIKLKVCSYYLGRKVVFGKWILVVFKVRGSVLIVSSVQDFRGEFIVVVLMCLGMEEVQGVTWCVSWEAGFIFEAKEENLSVLF